MEIRTLFCSNRKPSAAAGRIAACGVMRKQHKRVRRALLSAVVRW
jgi:hypothetical protein